MLRVQSLIKKQQGFSVVEALLAVVIFTFLVSGLIGAIIYGRSSTADAGDHGRAVHLAEEGIEAARNIGTASYANLVDSSSGSSTVGNTAIESSFDANIGTNAYKVTTGASGGSVSSVSVYIKTIDATNQHVQAAIYADASGTPGTLLGTSAIQIAVANSWNNFPISVTIAGSTNYWIALSEDGNTQYADSAGGITSYDLSGGYPAANPFSATTTATDRPSFYMTIAGSASTYGLAQTGNQWVFSGTSDTTGIYTRKITVSTDSTNRKKITSAVTWSQGTGTAQVSLDTYITNWRAASTLALWPNAVQAGSLDAASTNDGLKVASVGNYAYVARADGTPDFLIVDITNPSNPTLVGSLNLTGSPTNIAVSGNYAYVTTNSATAELQIINISNPAVPSLTGTFDAAGTASGLGVFVNGTTVYMTRAASATAGTNEFVIVNASNPASPTLVGSYNNDITMYEVDMSGNYAYVSTSSDTAEALVINITTPSAPVLATSVDLSGTADGLALVRVGTSLLVAQGSLVRSINITTPASAVFQGSVPSSGTGVINDITMDGTNVYILIASASTAAEFQVINSGTGVIRAVDVPGTTNSLNGIAYNASLDIAVGAGASDTQEVTVFTKN